jgi:hypothetical protein
VQFSDEATFHVGGYADKQNVHHWVLENLDIIPYIVTESQFDVHLPSIGLFRKVFIDNTVNPQVHLKVLQNDLLQS